MDDFLIVFVTASSPDEARAISRRLVEAKAAPCVNILPSCTSIYEWKGKREEQEESIMLIKTRRDCFAKVKEIVESLHSYDVPEVIAVPLVAVSEKYRAYLEGYFENDR